METSSLSVQLGVLGEGLRTTERSIERLEDFIALLDGADMDKQSAERLLHRLVCVRERIQAIRYDLAAQLAEPTNIEAFAPPPQAAQHLPETAG